SGRGAAAKPAQSLHVNRVGAVSILIFGTGGRSGLVVICERSKQAGNTVSVEAGGDLLPLLALLFQIGAEGRIRGRGLAKLAVGELERRLGIGLQDRGAQLGADRLPFAQVDRLRRPVDGGGIALQAFASFVRTALDLRPRDPCPGRAPFILLRPPRGQ